MMRLGRLFGSAMLKKHIPDFSNEVRDFFVSNLRIKPVLLNNKWMRFVFLIGFLSADTPIGAQMPLQYAKGFQVEYFDTYKVVTVLTPWPGATEPFQYVLVPHDAPPPPEYTNAQRIEIPIRRLITTSTTHLPHLDVLNEVASLVAIDGIKYVNTESVKKRFKAGHLAEVGHGISIDLEKILVLEPDLVITTATAQAQYNAHPVLQQAGVPVVINAAYAEPSLLGRAEWMKFVAAFFNKEEIAAARFDSVVAHYQTYSNKTRDLPANKRPTVFGGSLWRGTWFVAGGKTYMAQLIKDAGGTYLWAGNDSHKSLPFDFEAVYEKAHNVNFWIPVRTEWHTLADITNTDNRYSDFGAYKTGQIYNANARLNKNGGNDYWEQGLIEPHMMLADLIKIFHPALLPDYQLKYHKQLK